MTTLALIAEATVVNIVIRMATGAVARQADISFARAFVTGKTIKPLVRAIQLELGATVMVEFP